MADPSLDRATAALGNLSTSVRALTTEVVQSESLRTRKIKVIQHALLVLGAAVMLLVILAITNFVLLGRVNHAAADAKATNELLFGCFQPGTQCSESQRAQAMARGVANQQTTYVMLICLRLNPLAEDPDAIAVQRCVRQYYPGFSLPTKVNPSPSGASK